MGYIFDQHSNLTSSAVVIPPSPAISGGSLSITPGTGVLFPTPPFNCVVCPVNTTPTAANAEIIQVTNIVSDVFYIARTQESSSARTILVGDTVFVAMTAKVFTDVESTINDVASGAPAVRYKSGTGWQWFNGDTGLWHAKYCVGNPPQDAWDAGDSSGTIGQPIGHAVNFGVSAQMFTGPYSNPNGNIRPSIVSGPATYYSDNNPPNIWYWSISTQQWYQMAGF